MSAMNAKILTLEAIDNVGQGQELQQDNKKIMVMIKKKRKKGESLQDLKRRK